MASIIDAIHPPQSQPVFHALCDSVFASALRASKQCKSLVYVGPLRLAYLALCFFVIEHSVAFDAAVWPATLFYILLDLKCSGATVLSCLLHVLFANVSAIMIGNIHI